MRVLVTGASGFVGAGVTRRLRVDGHEVVPLARADADLRDREAVSKVVRGAGIEGVCHLAALTRVRDSLADPVGYFDVNVTGTANLLAALETSGSPVPLVLASTGAVYGARDGQLAEHDPALPINPYGASKRAAEMLVGHQAEAGKLAAITLRCFNVAGAVDSMVDGDLTRIIPKTLAVAAGRHDRVQVNGDGSARREYTHVLDVADAFALALAAAAVGRHRIYNVGSGQAVTLAEVVGTARRVTGREIPTEHLPPKPEAQVVMADSTRIRTELGWHPTRSSIEQIVRDAWEASL